MKAFFARIVRPLRGLPLMMRAIVIGGIAALVVTIVTVLAVVPSGPSGKPLLVQAAQSVTQTITGATPTPVPSAGSHRNHASGTDESDSRDIYGNYVCDKMSRTATPEQTAACTKGYIAPAVVFDSATCETSVPSGTYTITVTWKTVGGHFTTAHVTSRRVKSGLVELWTVANPTAETVVLDGRRVGVAIASMNGQPGTIDSVISSPSPRYTAGDLCGVTGSASGTGATPAPTDEPTPEPTP